MRTSDLSKKSVDRSVAVDVRLVGERAARIRAEKLIFKGKKKPRTKFDLAAQRSFMDLVMLLMKDGGCLIKP